MTKKLGWLGVALLGAAAAAQGQAVYVSDGTTPWGDGSIYNDMQAALPSTTFQSFGTAGAGVFNPGNTVIFIEGGNGYSGDFDTYFNTPGVVAAAQSWVAAGGSLIINGGRWTFDDLNLGFGLTMKNPGYGFASFTGNVVDGRIASAGSPDGLWQTIFSVAGAGSKAPGAGFSPMILTDVGNVSLGEENYGSGIVIAGGLTSPVFQSGSGSSYGGNYFNHDIIVPSSVPDGGSTVALLGLGLGGLAWLRNRKANS